MNYDIGLRIGITSCGWSIINKDLDRIEDLGVRVFEKLKIQMEQLRQLQGEKQENLEGNIGERSTVLKE